MALYENKTGTIKHKTICVENLTSTLVTYCTLKSLLPSFMILYQEGQPTVHHFTLYILAILIILSLKYIFFVFVCLCLQKK